MAEKAYKGMPRARLLALGMCLAGLLLSSGQAVQSQQAQPVGQPKMSAHTLFTMAKESYKRDDYNLAAQYFDAAERRKMEMNPTDRADLPKWIQKNNVALQGRRDGGFLLAKAEEALQQTPPRIVEADDYRRKAEAIPYTDKNLLQKINQKINQIKHNVPIPPEIQGNPKALLAAGRQALKRGDLDQAMSLAMQAKNAWSGKTMFWQDNPDKLIKDVEKAMQIPRPITPDGPAKKEPFSIFKIFHRDSAPNPPDKGTVVPNGPRNTNEGPILAPVPEGRDKTSKNTESSSPMPPANNYLSGGAANEKTQPDSNVKQVRKEGSNVVTPPVQVANAGPNSLPPPRGPVDTKANNAQARQLIQNGCQALQANDFESARRFALQAKELRPDLEWFEQNPDRLLAEIQKRQPGGVGVGVTITPAKVSEPAVAKVATAADKDEQARAKARDLVRQGRDLFKKNKLEDADKVCAQAAGVAGAKWGLFEDSPEKLRVDIQKARGRRDREESARLLTEARALYIKHNYQEAKIKAWQAQKLHGPYGIWDLGDRPQKVLADIEQAESKLGLDSAAKTIGQPESKVTPKEANTQVAKGKEPAGTWFPNPFHKTETVKAPVDSEAKAKARVLLAESRALLQQGQLVPAREKAVAAQSLGVVFSVGEDSPAAVLQDLGQQCMAQMNGCVKRAGDWVMAGPADPANFQKADAELAAARTLAAAFQLDTKSIDDKLAWIRQTASTGPANPPPPLQDPGTGPNQTGRDKLDMARLELKAGNTYGARRLAEDAFDLKYGVQEEAANVLRLIDTEEHNQVVLAALKSMQTGMDAFQRRDYLQARSILAGVDVPLLDPERKVRLREVLSLPELQLGPNASAQANASDVQQIGGLGVQVANAPGKAIVDDMNRPGGQAALESVRAMEDILFQKLYEESRRAQSQAMAQVKSGDTIQAIDTLKDYLGQLDRAQLEPEKLALIKKGVENRMQQYRTLQAQNALAQESAKLNQVSYSDGPRNKKILKTQDQVVELMDQYRALMKEGKYKDARLAALKAKELDPDNLAVIAALRIAAIEEAQKEHERNKAVNEDRVLKALDDDEGPYVHIGHPLEFNPERMKVIDQFRKGQNLQNGIPSGSHNAIERDIERKLTMPRSVSFLKQPLNTVIRDLQAISGVNIVLDTAALNEANIGLEQPLSLSVENISMKCILNLLLKQVNLTYVIKDEVLNITTESFSKGPTTRVVYPVADLVVPVENHPTPDIYSLEKLMEHHIANNGQVLNGNSPVLGPYGLPNGLPVGSSGLGSHAGMSPGANNDFAHKGNTMEQKLIDLITSTIAPDTWEGQGGPGRIQFFPLGMSLVIAQQTQDVQEQVQDLLAALRRLQDLEVAIEMRLVSVSEAFFEKIGVNFSMNIPTHNSQSNQNQLLNGSFQPAGVINTPFPPSLRGLVSGLTPAQTFTPDLGVPIRATSYAFSNPPFGGYPGTLTGDGGLALGLAFLSDIQVSMFMEAAQGDRRTNIMQAPKITVFNGATASINVNTMQFFLTSINLATSPFGQLIASPQQQPFFLGVSLTVTPVVSADRRFVRLNMTPTMTNLVDATVPLIPVQIPVPSTFFGPGNGTTSGQQESIFTLFFQQPSVSTITVNTTVNVPDGGTVLLGGLKTLSEGRNEFGPPILSKIPYISRLFKNVAYGREANSLMIMVTPRIIINEEEELIFRGIEPPIPRP